MDDERRYALELACGCAQFDGSVTETMARARAYLDFLRGADEAARRGGKSPLADNPEPG